MNVYEMLQAVLSLWGGMMVALAIGIAVVRS